MLIRYLVELREPIYIEDHWPIPIMGGEFRAVSQDGVVIAFEISFSGQSVDMAPMLERHEEGEVAFTMNGRDKLLPFVKMQLEEMQAYFQCYFDVEILADEIEAKYIGETKEEEEEIEIKSFKSKKDKPPLIVPYHLFSRAIMAAETGIAPKLEANLFKMARTEMWQGRYIDSFRYSFLLIESLYGDGKYKAGQLKNALKRNIEFVSIVENALKERRFPTHSRNSDTEKLISAFPTPEAVIDHLVEKRGFYFHGNLKRKNAWLPHEQETAEVLCLLSLCITKLIAQEAAMPMFGDSLSQRHFDNAKHVGAIMTMKVNFRYYDQRYNLNQEQETNYEMPGTKVTPKMAFDAAKYFLEGFNQNLPLANLKSATCTVEGTGQKVFDIAFHVEPNPEISEDT